MRNINISTVPNNGESEARNTSKGSMFEGVKTVGKDFSDIVKGVLSAKEEEQIQSKIVDLSGNTDTPRTMSQLIVPEGGVFIDPSLKGKKLILLDEVDEADKNKELIVPDPDGGMPDLDYRERMKTESLVVLGQSDKHSQPILVTDKNGNSIETRNDKKSEIITNISVDPNPKSLQLPNPDGTFDNDPTKSSTEGKTIIVPGFTPKSSTARVETDQPKTSQTPDSTPKLEVKKDLKLEDLFKENKGGNAKESKENVSKTSSHPEKQNSRESSSFISEKKTFEKPDKKQDLKKESKPFWTAERKKKWKENFQKFKVWGKKRMQDLGTLAYGFGKWGIVGAGITAGVLIPASLFVGAVTMPLVTSIVTANGVLMGTAGAIKEYAEKKRKEKESKIGRPAEKDNFKKGPMKNESKETVWKKIEKPFDDAAQTIRGWFRPKKK